MRKNQLTDLLSKAVMQLLLTISVYKRIAPAAEGSFSEDGIFLKLIIK